MSNPDTSALPETPTPGDIEAALSDLRAQISAPPPEPSRPAPPLPPRPPSSGWMGTAALALTAALLGGGAASFLPGLVGATPQNEDDARRRIDALESRIGQLAAGQSGEAAAQSFADLKSHLDGMEVRLRALEAASVQTGNQTGSTDEAPARLAAAEATLSSLTQRLAALEARLAAIPSAPQAAVPSPETSGEIAALKSALADLSARLGTLENVAPAGDLIASIDGRVSALESADPGRASRQAALALIVARLSGAAAEGQPFTAELAALKSAAPAVDVSPFEPYAGKGLPTVASLAAQLNTIDSAVREGADFDRGGDWLDRMWRGFGRLVTVHEDGLAEGMEPEDHLARAEYHAGRGDLSNAYAEMDQLSGSARGAAVLWLKEAGARLALDAALGQLTQTILADLARPQP